MTRILGDMEVFTNELRDTHGQARGTRTWQRLRTRWLGEIRDARCCTRLQCQGRGCGLKMSDISCEKHQYLHYQTA